MPKRRRRLNSSLAPDIPWNRTSECPNSEGRPAALPRIFETLEERDRPILAYGLMLLAAVSLVLNYFIKFPTLPDETAASFREYL